MKRSLYTVCFLIFILSSGFFVYGSTGRPGKKINAVKTSHHTRPKTSDNYQLFPSPFMF